MGRERRRNDNDFQTREKKKKMEAKKKKIKKKKTIHNYIHVDQTPLAKTLQKCFEDISNVSFCTLLVVPIKSTLTPWSTPLIVTTNDSLHPLTIMMNDSQLQ